MSYDGEGLGKMVSGKLFRSPLTLNCNNEQGIKHFNSGLKQTNGTTTETNGLH